MAKYVRAEYNGRVRFGILRESKVHFLNRNFLEGTAEETGETAELRSLRLLSPVAPPNVICIGLNYRDHGAETGNTARPDHPQIFLKATTAVIGPEDFICLPEAAPSEVDYEAELCVVIGKKAKNVSAEEAMDYVFGYTIGHDVSARDVQIRIDRQWVRGKSFDTFCPIGPVVETEADPSDLHISTLLNGKRMQDSTTANMIFKVPELISFISHSMTLLPGTVILTGTPEGVGFTRKPPVFLQKGDVVEITIENIGTLKNTVQ